MPHSISTLLLRNLQDVFGENDPQRRRAVIDEIYTEDVVFCDPNKGAYRGRDEIDRIAGVIKATHPDLAISRLRNPKKSATAGGFHGYRAALGKRRHMPGRISSSSEKGGLPPFISSSTSRRERGPRSFGKVRSEYRT
jgi:hypothetical protein